MIHLHLFFDYHDTPCVVACLKVRSLDLVYGLHLYIL